MSLVVLFTATVAACGSDDSGRGRTVAPEAGGGISVDEARERGLLRDDALSISGPEEIRARASTVALRVHAPAGAAARRAQIDVSGRCEASLGNGGGGARHAVVDLQRDLATVRLHAKLPAGRDSCIAVTDVLVPGRPETGSSHTLTLRRRS